MRALSGQELLRIWEIGMSQHPIERALTILSAAFPDISRDELIALSIGQRDGCLLDLREQTFGPTLHIFVECPQCTAHLEFDLATADIRVTPEVEVDSQGAELISDEFVLRFRQINSLDLAAVANCADEDTARRLLVQRCVLQATRGGRVVPAMELPDPVIVRLAEHLAKCHPQAEVLLNLECPSCRHHWQMVFDIVSFLWAEIAAQAKRLLHEVHALARFYGWREADILSMSTARRQFYLELMNANG